MSVREYSGYPAASSPGPAQGLEVSKLATNDTQLLVDIGVQKGGQLGHIDIPLPGMVDLSAEFVEEAHFLDVNTLNELNKFKQLMAPKETFFGESLARLEDFIVRQHAWLVLLSGKISQKGSSNTGKRAAKAKKRKDAPRADDSPKKAVPAGRLDSESAQKVTGNGKLSPQREKN